MGYNRILTLEISSFLRPENRKYTINKRIDLYV